MRLEGYCISFECDGKQFHDRWRDEWRDAITLGEGHVDVVYRLRGHDICFNVSDCLFLISHWEPEMFTVAGRLNLRSLVCSEKLVALAESAQRRVRQLVWR